MSKKNDRSPEEEDLLLLLLVFRRLIVREWETFYLQTEARQEALWKRVQREGSRAERRVAGLYRERLAGLDERSGLLNSPVSSAVAAEASMRSSVLQSVGEGNAVYRMSSVEMRKLHRRGVAQVAKQLDELKEAAGAVGLDEEVARLEKASRAVQPVKSTAPSLWALRRDLELLAERTAHRAALALHNASQGQRLSRALRDAPAATRISRGSLKNSTLGTSRMTLRKAVYTAAGAAAVFGGWFGIRPYPGGGTPARSFSERTWIETAAKKTAGDAWRPGNPISGFGLHVGSRTFFAPDYKATALATGLLRGYPGLPALIEVRDNSVYFDGQEVRSIDRFFTLASAKIAEYRRTIPAPKPGERPRMRAEIVGVFGKEEPRLYTVNRGREDGVLVGDRFAVFGPLGPSRSERKSVLAITALYPHVASGFVVVYDTLRPTLFDTAVLG